MSCAGQRHPAHASRRPIEERDLKALSFDLSGVDDLRKHGQATLRVDFDRRTRVDHQALRVELCAPGDRRLERQRRTNLVVRLISLGDAIVRVNDHPDGVDAYAQVKRAGLQHPFRRDFLVFLHGNRGQGKACPVDEERDLHVVGRPHPTVLYDSRHLDGVPEAGQRGLKAEARGEELRPLNEQSSHELVVRLVLLLDAARRLIGGGRIDRHFDEIVPRQEAQGGDVQLVSEPMLAPLGQDPV